MAVWPHGWKVISHGPSQRKQLGPVTESTSLSSVLLESPPDTETSGGVASLLVGVASPLVGVASLLVGVVSLLVGVASFSATDNILSDDVCVNVLTQLFFDRPEEVFCALSSSRGVESPVDLLVGVASSLGGVASVVVGLQTLVLDCKRNSHL